MLKNLEELAIKYVAIGDLVPNKDNPRTHTEFQVNEIIDSINRRGWTNPILLDGQNGIVAGHGRLLAAQKLGLKKVPTIDLSFASDIEKDEYIIADNKLALNAGWDYDILNIKFDLIENAGIDLKYTGFNEEELGIIRNPEILNEGHDNEDSVPRIEELPVSKEGDVWRVGNHRVMCGDSTNPLHVSALTLDSKFILMITDPPYGVNYDPEWRDGADLGVGERSRGKVKNDDKVDWSDAYSLFNGDIVYVWHAGIYSPSVAQHLINCGFEIVSQIIWVKQHFALSRGDYHWQHEPCWYAVKKGKKHNWQGKRDQATTWDIKNNNSFGNSAPEETWGHSTQKPLECMARPIQNNTKPNDLVYDPFGGSGTTLIACEKLGRVCCTMEISPQYCDVIVKRWQKFTQKKAILEATGTAFDEVANG